MTTSEIISVNPETETHQLVFAKTLVPIESLFFCVKQGISINEYLEYFPSVSKEQAMALLSEISR